VIGPIHANGFTLSNVSINRGNNFRLDRLALRAGLLAAALFCSPAMAFGMDVFTLTLKDHQFDPVELRVPANQRFRIEVENRDPTPAEFESSDLHLEKIVVGGGKITMFAGPLKPGTYKFFDDYHPDVAKGTIVATENAGN
jgi:hypothetical protein